MQSKESSDFSLSSSFSNGSDYSDSSFELEECLSNSSKHSTSVVIEGNLIYVFKAKLSEIQIQTQQQPENGNVLIDGAIPLNSSVSHEVYFLITNREF